MKERKEVQIQTFPLVRCANARCHNKIGEGEFQLVSIGLINLVMCVPCVNEFLKILDAYEV